MKEKMLLNVLYELMKNSRQSDRTIAEKLNVSQPTVTRARIALEKNNYINGYTAIPSFPKIGYELIVISFVKTKTSLPLKERLEAIEEGRKWNQEQPNIVFSAMCNGMGANGMMISFHKSYSDYVEFMKAYKSKWNKVVTFMESIMIHMSDEQLIKPLTFASLIEPSKNH
jgi:DNA-binding Lrp family transcriptional regulator